MDLKRPAEEIIRERRSCRTFENRPIEPDKLHRLEAFIEEQNGKAVQMRFALLLLEVGGKIGTYGMISGARIFIVGIVDKNREHIEEFGLEFEKIILLATDLGLGTCWLAGIDRRTFEGKIVLQEGEVVAVASPVGYAEKPRFKEGLVRLVVGADKRKPWEQLFFSENPGSPLTRDKAGDFALPLDMARLAPSASNKQPWRVICDGSRFHFCLERNAGYGIEQPFDIQKSDIGIAMCHFELTAKTGKWVYEENAEFQKPYEYLKTWEA